MCGESDWTGFFWRELERTRGRGAGTCGARSGRAGEPGSRNRGVRVLFVWPARGSACWIYRVSLSSFLFRLCAFRRCTLDCFRAASLPALISLSSFRYDADYILSGLQFVRRCPPSPPTPSINGNADGISHHRLPPGVFFIKSALCIREQCLFHRHRRHIPPNSFSSDSSSGPFTGSSTRLPPLSTGFSAAAFRPRKRE